MNNTVSKNQMDLSHCDTAAHLLATLNEILDCNCYNEQKIKVNLGELTLTNAHIFSLKTILESSDITIDILFTTSAQTQLAALGAGLVVSEKLEEFYSAENNAEENQEENNQENQPEDGQENQDADSFEKELEDAIDLESMTKSFDEDKARSTLYIKQTLRSGQSVNYDGNVVIIGDCKPGSEVIATGDINVWGVISGIAHAGASGDYNTNIRALKINAIQLRIANLFARKPDRSKVDKLNKISSFIPEEARISQGEIIIYPLNG